MTKTDAQYKQDQRLRDKLLLEEIGFNSLEGVMSAIRKLDEHGLENLQAILRGRVEPVTKAQSKTGKKTTVSRTGKGEGHRAGTSSHKTQDRRKG